MTENMIAKDILRSYVERIERLENDKLDIAQAIRDVYAEAKGNGFDVKTLREVIKLRKLDSADRSEQEQLLEIYMHALGMV